MPAGEGAVAKEGAANPAKTIFVSGLVEEQPGTRVGHYKILQHIGEGGCGVVYMAEQEEPIRRRVALKVIKLGMDTKEVIARFEAERQALALMDHPNIAKVLDAGATETGRPYFVMELVKGIKITDFCDQNKLATKERLDLFIQVCHAIQHAHQKGIIHRDIKPSNVLVTLHDGVPVPKVIDFGIAKATQQPLTDKTVFTAFGQFIGTPAYMSPEQAELSGLDIDTRTDIYSLGVLLYELLTGKPPFDPETLLKAGLDEMRRIIRETEPPKPSTKLATARATTPHSAVRIPQLKEVRGDLDWIVMKCLEKDRTRRYETATGLALDIQHHLKSEPVTAGAPGVTYRAGKFVRRHKAGLATATVLALVLVAGSAVSLWQAALARRHAREAQAQLGRLYDQQGWTLQEQGNGLGAFCSFVGALTLAEPGSAQEMIERLRLGFVGQTLPRLEAGLLLPASAGDVAANIFELNTKWIHDETSGQALWIQDDPSQTSLLIISPDGHWLVHRLTGETWDLEQCCPSQRLGLSQGWAPQASFDPASKRLITTCRRYPPRGSSSATTSDVLTEIQAWVCGTWAPVSPGVIVTGAIPQFAFSADGRRFVAAVVQLRVNSEGRLSSRGEPGETIIFDTLTCRQIGSPRQQTNGVTAVSLSSDGRIVSSRGWHGAEVFDADSGQTIARHRQYLQTLIGPRGRYVLSDGTFAATVCELRGDRNLGSFERDGPPSCFSPDGKLVASATRTNSVQLRELPSLKVVQSLPHPDQVLGVVFSPDASKVLTTCADYGVRLWDPTSGRQIGSTLAHEGTPQAAFASDARRFISIARDQVVRVWSLAEQTSPGITLSHPAKVNDAAFSTDGGMVVTACEDGIVRSWDRRSGRLLNASPKQDGSLMHLAFRPDGTLTTVSMNHTAQVWDPVSLKPLGSPLVFTNFANASCPALCLSPDGQFMAELRKKDQYYREKVEVWQIAPPRLLFAHSRNQQFMGPLFSPNSRLLIVPARNDNHEAVYEVPGGRHVQLNYGQDLWLTRAVSPDSVRYATIDPSKRILTIGFLRPATNSINLRFPANLNDVAFSPDSTRCVTSSDDFSARVWDLEKCHQLGKVLHHERPVLSASWSPDGSLVATAGMDRTARVWHMETGEPVTPSLRHDGAVNRVVFSRDGRGLLTIAQDRTVRIWSLSIDRQPTDGLRLMARFMNSRAEEQDTGEPRELSFASPATTGSKPDLKAWHEQEIEKAERDGQWFAVVFHLGRWLQMEPDNVQLKRRLTEAEARLAAAEAGGVPQVEAPSVQSRSSDK